jgi:glycosyltransferase involved in cell wall biosynthesis
MRDWANRCARLVVLAEAQVLRANELLGVDPERCVVAPNGFDPAAFRPVDVDRAAHWRHHLVDAPRGWRPDGEEGSVAYTERDVERMTDGPVLVCAGRFTEVKRTGLVISAFMRAQEHFDGHASLVLVGGHPGEWEGEHPADVVDALGATDVFLAGWHDHKELPAIYNACDAMVLASVREQFGSVLVEAMACGLPAIAVDRYGPADIVRDGETGWLVEPDDEAALAAAMVEAVNHPEDRRRRGVAARRDARKRFAWPALSGRLAAVFDDVAGIEGPVLDAVGS